MMATQAEKRWRLLTKEQMVHVLSWGISLEQENAMLDTLRDGQLKDDTSEPTTQLCKQCQQISSLLESVPRSTLRYHA
jgi:hypothetical protein